MYSARMAHSFCIIEKGTEYHSHTSETANPTPDLSPDASCEAMSKTAHITKSSCSDTNELTERPSQNMQPLAENMEQDDGRKATIEELRQKVQALMESKELDDKKYKDQHDQIRQKRSENEILAKNVAGLAETVMRLSRTVLNLYKRIDESSQE
ncbi:uncharacterized protein BDZ99DRAFT_482648 [Mytilinidion resinicola]|uniref:Uncharacterized protein n=1 Tax=Mytilinidion resinicola TaxID=574789 RepID=A0A6A6Y4S5_9PEZI|nr:uncharacterized protein BDZ99DRAFT_482648 [Mytilinidion resinicola]KAF2802797.1 hypothetical protein BDZ99DRAFT_482648 [Mytilinidion resinicola]